MTLLYRPGDLPIDFELLGGKAVSLARLTNWGLPVPAWTVVTTRAFERFVAPARYAIFAASHHLPDASEQEIEAMAAALQTRLRNIAVDEELASEIELEFRDRADALVSVRSSAVQEDSATQSFAGIFTTALNVRNSQVLARIKECWLSPFSSAALKYLQQTNVPLSDVAMAVVIQEMVFADKAGVLFQANPAGSLNELVIVAGYGLGEGIVAGQVGTDTIRIDRSSGAVAMDIAEKLERIDPHPQGGVQTSLVPPTLANQPALTDDDLQQLLRLDRMITGFFVEVQDVEWAIDRAGKAWLLQSRAITTLPPGPIQLYDNSNIVESYPDVSSPLTISIVRNIYRQMFYYMFRLSGYSAGKLQQHEEALSHLVAPIQGRIYYNISNWYKMMAMFPLANRLFVPALEDSIGIERSVIRERPRGGMERYVFATWLCAKYVAYRPVFSTYRKKYISLLKSVEVKTASTHGDRELNDLYARFFEDVFPVESFGRLSDAYLMAFLYVVRRLVLRRGLDEDEALSLVNGLLVGEPDLESVKPVRSVRVLARRLAAYPHLLEELDHTKSWHIAAQQIRKVDPTLVRAFLDHLEHYGDRSIAELKFETRTFREEPLGLLKVVVAYVRSGAGQTEAENRETALRADAERRLRSMFRGPAQIVARHLTRKLRQFIRAREYTRLNRARYYGVIRAIIGKIADDWVSRGIIEDATDIFFLQMEEIQTAISTRNYGELAAVIVNRRDAQAKLSAFYPRSRMWLKGEITQNTIPQQPDVAIDGADRSATGWSGMGCCPGIITAETIVLRSPSDADDVHGKIIVAESTDPGWAFLIMKAKGLIMEKGSLLSHTAIIGREMGIPTIVGVKHATSLIPTGVSVTIDGTTGSIRMAQSDHKPSASERAPSLATEQGSDQP